MKIVRKTVKIGNEAFLRPFVANGNWVEDAQGTNVAEARNSSVAKDLAKMLNSLNKESA